MSNEPKYHFRAPSKIKPNMIIKWWFQKATVVYFYDPLREAYCGYCKTTKNRLYQIYGKKKGFDIKRTNFHLFGFKDAPANFCGNCARALSHDRDKFIFMWQQGLL